MAVGPVGQSKAVKHTLMPSLMKASKLFIFLEFAQLTAGDSSIYIRRILDLFGQTRFHFFLICLNEQNLHLSCRGGFYLMLSRLPRLELASLFLTLRRPVLREHHAISRPRR